MTNTCGHNIIYIIMPFRCVHEFPATHLESVWTSRVDVDTLHSVMYPVPTTVECSLKSVSRQAINCVDGQLSRLRYNCQLLCQQ